MTVRRIDRHFVRASDALRPGVSTPDAGQTALELFFDHVLQGVILMGQLGVHLLVLGQLHFNLAEPLEL